MAKKKITKKTKTLTATPVGETNVVVSDVAAAAPTATTTASTSKLTMVPYCVYMSYEEFEKQRKALDDCRASVSLLLNIHAYAANNSFPDIKNQTEALLTKALATLDAKYKNVYGDD